jgi:ATP synthase protein I
MPKRPSDEDALERLHQRLDAMEARTTRKPSGLADKAGGAGYRLMAELVSGVLAGLGLGWLVDQYAHTKPWGMLIGVVLGTVASVILVVNAASRMSDKAQHETGPPKAVPFDDEEDE